MTEGAYLLGYSNSWEPRYKISDISFYSSSLLNERSPITNTGSNICNNDDSKVEVYLLDYSNSWESRENVIVILS